MYILVADYLVTLVQVCCHHLVKSETMSNILDGWWILCTQEIPTCVGIHRPMRFGGLGPLTRT